jgi:hypothetical protein
LPDIGKIIFKMIEDQIQIIVSKVIEEPPAVVFSIQFPLEEHCKRRIANEVMQGKNCKSRIASQELQV